MTHTVPPPIACARARFPAGLEQPEGSLRFGADALLLAAFAARHLEAAGKRDKQGTGGTGDTGGTQTGTPAVTVAELGSGCGAALLALALRCPQVKGLGLEREAALVQASQNNAALLGLSDRINFMALDLADRAALAALLKTGAAETGTPENGISQAAPHRTLTANLPAVMANPPYATGGRPSPRPLRETALRGHASVLHVFCNAAALLLRHQGHFFCIYAARALPRLCAALQSAGLGVRHILPVHVRAGDPALRVLLTARKHTAHDCVLEAPLYLHPHKNFSGSHGGSPLWTEQALLFCPWLGKNQTAKSVPFTTA